MGIKALVGHQHHIVEFLCVPEILFSFSEDKLEVVVFWTYEEMPSRDEEWSNLLRGDME